MEPVHDSGQAPLCLSMPEFATDQKAIRIRRFGVRVQEFGAERFGVWGLGGPRKLLKETTPAFLLFPRCSSADDWMDFWGWSILGALKGAWDKVLFDEAKP